MDFAESEEDMEDVGQYSSGSSGEAMLDPVLQRLACSQRTCGCNRDWGAT